MILKIPVSKVRRPLIAKIKGCLINCYQKIKMYEKKRLIHQDLIKKKQQKKYSCCCEPNRCRTTKPGYAVSSANLGCSTEVCLILSAIGQRR